MIKKKYTVCKRALELSKNEIQSNSNHSQIMFGIKQFNFSHQNKMKFNQSK